MMIYTVRDNLKKTIEGKEKYLTQLTKDLLAAKERGTIIALDATVKFLEVNINELKVILFDVEKCCEKVTADSWALNPDRSGGAFTDEEINRGNEWH